jgi:PKD repeat protein
VDGGFVFDFTDLLNSRDGLTRFYLGLTDDTSGDTAFLNSFSLIDLENGFVEKQCTQAPVSADNQQVYVYVDYASSDQNLPPEAVFSVSDTGGRAPALIRFDGTSSFDQDGSVVSWSWDFGDRSSQSGSMVDHTYDSPG